VPLKCADSRICRNQNLKDIRSKYRTDAKYRRILYWQFRHLEIIMRRDNFPSLSEIVEVYASIMHRATGAERDAGGSWYDEANAFAHTLCNLRTDWSLEVAASVISAFSPRERWASNKAKAHAFALCLPVRGLTANIRRAEEATRIGLDALRGPKIRAFAEAIIGDPNAIVIDTHMLKPIGKSGCTELQYARCAEAVAIVAGRFNASPRDTQATIWVVHRGRAD
jgi:hypothetical protein